MRVRQIITSLNYDALVNTNVIPDIVSMFEVVTKKYPSFVYASKNFSFFGMLMDYWVRVGFRSIKEFDIDLGVDPSGTNDNIKFYQDQTSVAKASLVVLKIVRSMLGEEGFTEDNVKSYIPTLVNTCKELNKEMLDYRIKLGSKLLYNQELVSGSVSGHPDVVTPKAILDIKTTSGFKTMGKEACLQILAYYALSKSMDSKVTRIGLILPMQRQVQLLDVRKWDYKPYLKVLTNIACPQPVIIGPNLLSLFPVGNHIAKTNNLASTFKSWVKRFKGTGVPVFPVQMFLRSPRSKHAKNCSLDEFKELNRLVKKYDIPYFTHSPYIVNLCKDMKDKDGTPWARKLILEDIKHTIAIGGKGIVVHTGSACGINKKDGLDTMEKMVRKLLNKATQECKLLLETPCAEGAEVCTTIKEMNDFFARFTEDERKKLGLCIDTAHIHAAGYDILQYILEWIDIGVVDIGLVHYNDSEVCCGSHKDRHAYPGQGHIGYESMFNVAVLCKSKNIPMVFE